MECFFHSFIRENKSESNHNAIISFTIPDIGVVFRAAFRGGDKEVEYAALLALLEFVETNPQLFKNRALENLLRQFYSGQSGQPPDVLLQGFGAVPQYGPDDDEKDTL